MDTMVTRNFKVRGRIRGLYSANGGTPVTKYIEGMNVELWYKGPMDVVFLGTGSTTADGQFIVEFETESPTLMIVEGKINNVFLRVIYNGNVLIGDIDPGAGSFD